MLATIFATIAVFMGSSIEEIPIFVLLFTQEKDQRDDKYISLGIILGNFVIICMSILLSYALGRLPNEKIIDLFGLIPLFMGIATLSGFEKNEEDKLNRVLTRSKTSSLVITSAIITLALGGDDTAIYIPFFLTIHGTKTLFASIILMFLVILQCLFSARIYELKPVANFLKKYEECIVPVIFIPLGFYILYKYEVLAFLGIQLKLLCKIFLI